MAGAASLRAVPPAGMVLGYDRHGVPVVARVFRPTGTRIVVVGGLRTAQVLALRALAVGARIDVRTRRWGAWHEFAEEIAAVDSMTVTPDAAPLQRWSQPRGAPTPTPRSADEGQPSGRQRGGLPDINGQGTHQLDNGTHDETWHDINAITGRLPGAHPGAPAAPLKPRLTVVDVATHGMRADREREGVADADGRIASSTTSQAERAGSSIASQEGPSAASVNSRRVQATSSAAGEVRRERSADGHQSAGHGSGPAQRTTTVGRGSMRRHVLEVGGEEDLVADPGTATGEARTAPDPAARWHAVVTVRDELTEADAGLLGAADLVVLQTLRPEEAVIAADALGLAAAEDWLTRIRDEMVAVVSDGGLRWVVLATTSVERSMIGPATRWDEPATPSYVDASRAVTRPGNSR